MENFASYILGENDYIQKMIITYYLSKKEGIYFDKSIVLRAEIARMFIHYAMIDVPENIVITEMLLCNCKKVDDAQKIGKLETYAKEGAEYLKTLGFNDKFCKTCEEVNRYSGSSPRERESDILELVDQFVGLILNRPERPAFTPEEALVILKDRNLKDSNNRYLNDFIKFVTDMETVFIKETIEVPVIKKLISIHNTEANVKTFITILGNEYTEKIDELINNKLDKEVVKKTSKEEPPVRIVKRYVKVPEKKERAMFTEEIANRIMNHESNFKIEDEDNKKEGV